MIAIFWICFGLVVYAYLGYPVLIVLAARILGTANEAPPLPAPPPMVSILVIAHNEAAGVAGWLAHALAVDYPPDRIEVVVACDGSTDQTAEVARSFADRGVRTLDFAERRGKAATLAMAMPLLEGQLVVFSDVNAAIRPGAVTVLARSLGKPGVGVACGCLILVDPSSGLNADGLYWRYETKIKLAEARLGGLLGANGAIYAIRRELFVPIPPGVIIEDLVIPLIARLRHGCTIAYEPDAIAVEGSSPDTGVEFRRRVRIGAGGFQAICLLWPLFDPRRGLVSLSFVSHKVLRWIGPFLLIGILISNLALALRTGGAWRWALIAQLVFYAASALVGLLPRMRLPRLVRLATMFALMNAGLLAGFFVWVTGRQRGIWRPTPRSGA